jgi:hypothetical protein
MQIKSRVVFVMLFVKKVLNLNREFQIGLHPKNVSKLSPSTASK